jgi:two-component system cell cycle response regulator
MEKLMSSEWAGSAAPARGASRNGPATRPSEVRESCRVLVVDDDAEVRARLSALLNASQYEVEQAPTARDALRILDTMRCHIVLTDWQMPDMDGLALCRHIRGMADEGYIYVLMLTVRDTALDVMAGLAAGADAYVVKGAALNDILARVEIARRIAYERSPSRSTNVLDRGPSQIDPITGAHNLDYLVQHLPRELMRSQRYGHSLSILTCDIDGFHRFADRFGQAAANEWQRTFVAAAGGCIRNGDWLARTGGGAFSIVLPETAAKGAHHAAHKLRLLFAPHPLSTPADPVGFTVSIETTVAVEAKCDSQSEQRIQAVLRSAVRKFYTNERFDSDPADLAETFAIEPAAPDGGKHGLN